MCRASLLTLIVALAAAFSSDSWAAGSFQTKAALQNVVRADVAVPAPQSSEPAASPSDFLPGCGKWRVRDPQAHACRGPGDVR